MSYLHSDFFAQNRSRLRYVHAQDLPLVVAANGLLQRTADTTHPFAQDSNFWYLTGIDEPDLTLVIGRDEDYIIVPEKSDIRAFFDGANDLATWSERSGVECFYGQRDGWNRLRAELQSKTPCTVGVLQPSASYDIRHGVFANPAKRRVTNKIKQLAKDVDLVDLRPALAELRTIKQPVEIECIEKAIGITKQVLESATTEAALGSMTHEYQLEAEITAGFRRLGASGHAYAPIVAVGRNAATLHYVRNNSLINQNEYIVIDVGAEVEHYAADITRTVMLGEPTDRQRSIYEAVVKAQQYAISLIRPGATFKENEQAVVEFIADKLKQLGLIELAADSSAARQYFPHATSHFLGLDVHDVGQYTELQPGMVITCEPGIYVPAESIGVRIEDDILVTPDGCRVL